MESEGLSIVVALHSASRQSSGNYGNDRAIHGKHHNCLCKPLYQHLPLLTYKHQPHSLTRLSTYKFSFVFLHFHLLKVTFRFLHSLTYFHKQWRYLLLFTTCLLLWRYVKCQSSYDHVHIFIMVFLMKYCNYLFLFAWLYAVSYIQAGITLFIATMAAVSVNIVEINQWSI